MLEISSLFAEIKKIFFFTYINNNVTELLVNKFGKVLIKGNFQKAYSMAYTKELDIYIRLIKPRAKLS